MNHINQRSDGRAIDQLRSISVQHDVLGYAHSSVLFSIGNTKVLASVTLQVGVPLFLRGQRTGWLTAEYAMLPCSTQKRIMRESSQSHKNARSVEISRLIGRCLRTVVDLDLLGEKTIIIDCDVLQADGGTRVACITAASLALSVAARRWIDTAILEHNVVKDCVAAISAGMINEVSLLDLSFQEDNQIDADFNFVMTKSGKLIEVQGTAEKKPLAWQHFDLLKELACKGITDLFSVCSKIKIPEKYDPLILSYKNRPGITHHAKKASLDDVVFKGKKVSFSLGKRFEKI